MVAIEVDMPSQEDDFRQKNVNSEHRLPPNFPTFDELFAIDDVRELRGPIFSLLENGLGYSEQELAEAAIGFDSMADAFQGKKRKHTPLKDAATHMALVALLDAHAHLTLAGERLSVDQLVLDFHHDDMEDLGDDQSQVAQRLTERGYPIDRAAVIALGVELLTRYDGDDQQEYLDRIRANDMLEGLDQLRPRHRKQADTRQVLMAYATEIRDPTFEPDKARRYRDRKVISGLTTLGEAGTANTIALSQTLVEFNEQLALRYQRDQRAARRITAHVPA